ncbi:putative pectinesterase/pectinesterase inhibitor 7 [Bienertia sinuspersici]
MSEKAKADFQTNLSHRHGRLLDSNNDNDNNNDEDVLISDVVSVSQDGSGNFSSIMEAVGAAPNKTEADDGTIINRKP